MDGMDKKQMGNRILAFKLWGLQLGVGNAEFCSQFDAIVKPMQERIEKLEGMTQLGFHQTAHDALEVTELKRNLDAHSLMIDDAHHAFNDADIQAKDDDGFYLTVRERAQILAQERDTFQSQISDLLRKLPKEPDGPDESWE